MDSHLESATRKHLDLACVKLNSSQAQLVEQRAQLDETQAQLSSTQAQLKNTQETTRKLEEKLEALQTQLETKVNADKGADNKRFIWKIENFSEILRQAKAIWNKEQHSEMIKSDPFYTGCYGYKLQVIVRPYLKTEPQQDDGTLLPQETLYFGIASVEGEYDDILPWPFSKKITFTVIDQNQDINERKNLTADLRPGSRAPIFYGRPRGNFAFDRDIVWYIPHEWLQTRDYILNDNLFLQVDVGPEGLDNVFDRLCLLK